MKSNLTTKSLYFKAGLETSGIVRIASLVLASAILTGCPASNQTSQPPQTAAAPSNPNKIVIRGSNTIGEELAPTLAAEFKKDHAGIEFDIETKATGYGYAALRSRKCDVAAASRFPTKEEVGEATAMNVVPVGVAIGTYSVAVIVNAHNSVSGLTKAQVEGIFSGAITNWHDVGGSDSAIHLVARDPISGTHIGFKEIAMHDKPYAIEQISFADSYSGVAEKVGQDESAIGYTGIQSEPATVKTVSIDGEEPTAASVNAGKYPYLRSLYLYTLKGETSSTAKSFVDYVASPNGQSILAKMGFVPHP